MGARSLGVASAFSLALVLACGGAADNPLLDYDSGGGDAGIDLDAEGTDGGNCDQTKCPPIPAGFTIVTLAQGQACPSGWGSNDAVTNPTAEGGACTCACNVSQQPDCTQDDVTRAFDDGANATCGNAATSFPQNQGGCTAFQGLYLNHGHYSATAPAPSGGACTYDAHVDQGKVSGTPVHVCSAPASCPALACKSGSMCVAQDGDVACPQGFDKKTLVGSAATATCDGCGAATCAVTGTCSGKIAFFTDTQCQAGEVDFNADGSCVANPAGTIGPYYSYSTDISLAKADCAGAPPTATATASLQNPKTICCQ